ncbi:hypothetical protein RvY_10052-1 [Ramazzottius varieornatus]|uniref:Uncharacterized protein n=1 Tax=Ramazzottius varieornatus TaxID=947166 RepID=A0A1D1VGT9_RAMVA|nr:hypothetical protein RvY_10052-1 [Ramazzottius varieornatus]
MFVICKFFNAKTFIGLFTDSIPDRRCLRMGSISFEKAAIYETGVYDNYSRRTDTPETSTREASRRKRRLRSSPEENLPARRSTTTPSEEPTCQESPTTMGQQPARLAENQERP